MSCERLRGYVQVLPHEALQGYLVRIHAQHHSKFRHEVEQPALIRPRCRALDRAEASRLYSPQAACAKLRATESIQHAYKNKIMSSHLTTLRWHRGGKDFDYKSYSRDHELDFGHGVTLRASAAPAFLGSPEVPDPEQAFVAALSSCHMLTFLALASRQGWTLESYTDNAVGFLEKGEDAKLMVTRVELHPATVFAA
ncbi:MAG: OsmC family protein, partial [Polyangiaceae bacterium]|nr:OsmC family protein [Polyangiaceae bacterium]